MIRFKELILPEESVVLPDSAKTGKLQHRFENLSFTYVDTDGSEKKGTYSITLLGNKEYDIKILPDNLPKYVQQCLLNSFFYKYNLIYNEVHPFK